MQFLCYYNLSTISLQVEDQDEQDPVAYPLYLVLMRVSAIYKAIKNGAIISHWGACNSN